MLDSSDLFEKYLNRAFHFLSFRPRSEKEVRDRLLLKKAPPEIIERVINSLKENKFLNDEEFAKWFIENRLRFNPKGLRIIKMELKQKGIDRDLIDQTISNSLQSGGQAQLTINNSELESAKKLVEKKMPRYKGLEKQEIYNKLGSFLARRGFDWDTIKKSIDSEISRS